MVALTTPTNNQQVAVWYSYNQQCNEPLIIIPDILPQPLSSLLLQQPHVWCACQYGWSF